MVKDTIFRLISQHNLNTEEIDNLRNAFELVETIIDALGFCLSEEGDLLSQWRGYADDGQGFSIGFSKAYLKSIYNEVGKGKKTFSLHKVKYNPEEHEKELNELYEYIKNILVDKKLNSPRLGLVSHSDKDAQRERSDLHSKFISKFKSEIFIKSADLLFQLKKEAFKEEKEWRLISHYIHQNEYFDDSIEFRAAENRLIPYRNYELIDSNWPKITNIYIGPKNITPNNLVVQFLRKHDFKDATVTRSTASYR